MKLACCQRFQDKASTRINRRLQQFGMLGFRAPRNMKRAAVDHSGLCRGCRVRRSMRRSPLWRKRPCRSSNREACWDPSRLGVWLRQTRFSSMLRLRMTGRIEGSVEGFWQPHVGHQRLSAIVGLPGSNESHPRVYFRPGPNNPCLSALHRATPTQPSRILN